MQITIETRDKEELKNAINNAFIAYFKIASAANLCLDLPADFEQMLHKKVGDDPDKRFAFLKNRLDLLKELHDQL